MTLTEKHLKEIAEKYPEEWHYISIAMCPLDFDIDVECNEVHCDGELCKSCWKKLNH